MKKLTITLIILTALITSNINAQEKEPTKKETFDFIVDALSKSINWLPNEYSVRKIIDFDYNQELFIKAQTTLHKLNLKCTTEYNFQQIKSVSKPSIIGKNINIYVVTITFKKANGSICSNVDGSNSKSLSLTSENFHFRDEKEAVKFYKANSHLKALIGDINKSLFDD